MNSLFYLIYFIKKLMEKNYGNVSDVLLKSQQSTNQYNTK